MGYPACSLRIPNCPVRAVLHTFKLAEVLNSNEHAEGPAMFKVSLVRCSIDSTKYSGHSFQRGGTTFAQSHGVPGHYLKLQGNAPMPMNAIWTVLFSIKLLRHT